MMHGLFFVCKGRGNEKLFVVISRQYFFFDDYSFALAVGGCKWYF